MVESTKQAAVAVLELAWIPLGVIAYNGGADLFVGAAALAFLAALASASARMDQGQIPLLHGLWSLWRSLPGTLGYLRDRWMLMDFVLEARRATITVNGKHVKGVRFDANLVEIVGTPVRFLLDVAPTRDDRRAFEAAVAAAREIRGDTREVPPSLRKVRQQSKQ